MKPKTWVKSLLDPAKEFNLSILKPIFGQIPPSLNGALFRNGPALFTRNGVTDQHWFDGDGAILGVYFNQGKVHAQYKYVRTPYFIEEEKAGKHLYETFSKVNPQGWLKRINKKNRKNAVNTSVLQLPDKLLALYEAGEPFGLESTTFEPLGFNDLGGAIQEGATFSAHPKVDYSTQEIYNIGLDNPRKLIAYRLDKNGKLLAKNEIAIPWGGMVHDNVLAGKYFVTILCPLKINIWKLLLKNKSFQQSMEWKPEEGSIIYVFNRNDMSLACKPITIDPFWVFHYTNGFENKDGNIEFELIKYKDYATVDNFLKQIPSLPKQPKVTYPFPETTLDRFIIDPKAGKVINQRSLGVKKSEFPVVADPKVGENWRYSFLALVDPNVDKNQETVGQIGKYDHKTDSFVVSKLGNNLFPSEPILANGNEDPESGHILSVVFNAEENRSEVWVFNSEHIDQEPICVIPLPEIIPPGFHGRWTPKAFNLPSK